MHTTMICLFSQGEGGVVAPEGGGGLSCLNEREGW